MKNNEKAGKRRVGGGGCGISKQAMNWRVNITVKYVDSMRRL